MLSVNNSPSFTSREHLRASHKGSENSPNFGAVDREKLRQKVSDNSTEMTIGGGAGIATFSTLRNSSKIGNSLVKAVKNSKTMKLEKQTQILEVLGKFKPLAKYVNNPIVKKSAGALAGLSAVTGLVGSTAKIADTCNFLTAQNSEI